MDPVKLKSTVCVSVLNKKKMENEASTVIFIPLVIMDLRGCEFPFVT